MASFHLYFGLAGLIRRLYHRKGNEAMCQLGKEGERR
nr:MAG TPA: hypothetical protein [Caudoviricetes sp.]